MTSSADPPYRVRGAASYWEPARQRGRRYRAIDSAESEAMRRHLGCGDGELTAHLDPSFRCCALRT